MQLSSERSVPKPLSQQIGQRQVSWKQIQLSEEMRNSANSSQQTNRFLNLSKSSSRGKLSKTPLTTKRRSIVYSESLKDLQNWSISLEKYWQNKEMTFEMFSTIQERIVEKRPVSLQKDRHIIKNGVALSFVRQKNWLAEVRLKESDLLAD